MFVHLLVCSIIVCLFIHAFVHLFIYFATGRVSRRVALDPAISKCEKGLEICCRHPDWRDVPPETYIEIGKPSPNCKTDESYDDDYYSSLECNVNGIAYGDLDEIPDDDPCNSCYCDYGEVKCTKDLCAGKSPEKPNEGNLENIFSVIENHINNYC